MMWRGGCMRRLCRARGTLSSSTSVEFNESPPSSAKARISREWPKRTHGRGSSLAVKVPPRVVSSSLSLVAYPKARYGPIRWVLFQFPILRQHQAHLKRSQQQDNMHDSTSVVESKCRTLSLKPPQHHLHESGESGSVHLDPSSFLPPYLALEKHQA